MTKTTRNNFDKSSSGIDIEITCFYDTDLSRVNFEDNFKMIQYSGYNTTSISYYTDAGNVEGPDAVKFTVKGTTQAIIKAAREYTGVYSDLVAASGKELDDVKAEILSQFEDVNLINYALGKLPKIDGLEFVPNKNLIVLETQGYSQGDYAKVIYCPEDLEKAWGNYPKQEDIQKTVDHYFWDAPIYANFKINRKEYSYYDIPEYDEYEWKRDEFIEYVAEKSKVDKEILRQFVPEYPAYN